jgi:drug/metabolite transporter (DMT)-like permease
VVLTYMSVGAVTTALLMVVVSSEFLLADIAFGAVSGVFAAAALVLLYHGMAVSSPVVVSPTAAVVTAVIPVVWGFGTGEEIVALVVVGMVVAVFGLMATTFSPELGDRVFAALGWGLGAGTSFGVGFVFVGEVSEASGMWAGVSQRVAAFVVLALIAIVRGIPRFVDRPNLSFGLAGGVLTGLGVAAFVYGAQRGSLSEITVTASMFPAVTVVLVAVVDRVRLWWWQMAGIVGVVAGVVLIGVG